MAEIKKIKTHKHCKINGLSQNLKLLIWYMVIQNNKLTIIQ